MTHPEPWAKPDFDRADAVAIKALATGTANEAQQKIAIEYIVHTLAGTYQETYCPGSERDSAFAQGRRWVGLQIVYLCNVSVAELDKIEGLRRRARDAREQALQATPAVRTNRGFLRG